MYEKQTWKSGEIVTEGKLNHMEDGIATGGGIYSVSEVYLFDGEVTTVSDDMPYAGTEDIAFEGELPKHDISVTFNGQNYTLPYGNVGHGDYWGEVADDAPSLTNYPVFIYESDTYEGGIYTAEAGTYSLKIVGEPAITVNESFKNSLGVTLVIKILGQQLDKTAGEIYDAFIQNKVVFIYTDTDNAYLAHCTMTNEGVFEFYFIGISIGGASTPTPTPIIAGFSANSRDEYPLAIRDN